MDEDFGCFVGVYFVDYDGRVPRQKLVRPKRESNARRVTCARRRVSPGRGSEVEWLGWVLMVVVIVGHWLVATKCTVPTMTRR